MNIKKFKEYLIKEIIKHKEGKKDVYSFNLVVIRGKFKEERAWRFESLEDNFFTPERIFWIIINKMKKIEMQFPQSDKTKIYLKSYNKNHK